MDLNEAVPDELIPKTVPALAWLAAKVLFGAVVTVAVGPLVVWSHRRAGDALIRFGREQIAKGSKRGLSTSARSRAATRWWMRGVQENDRAAVR